MDTSKRIPERTIFPKGEKISGESIANDHFTGTVWLQVLVPDERTFNCPMFNVTFEPGARNNWHKHPGGQLLLVTGGKGYYQEWGRKAQVIREGDVVKIRPDVKHWHGAAPDSWLSHIAISTNVQAGDAGWLEPVTDEEYHNLP
jgi:quercetin dioxygenase-like cupin family protein